MIGYGIIHPVKREEINGSRRTGKIIARHEMPP
jgi:hypothetical protein